MTRLDIISDPVCPWCYIGASNLAWALEARGAHPFALAWRPYQLNPDMPAEGMERRAYLEVENFSARSKPVALQVSGAGAHRIDRSVTLGPGEVFSEGFALSGFEGGAIRASLTTPGDAFEPDNFAYSYLPSQRKIRVHLVSPGNPYLESALRANRGVRLSVTTSKDYPEQRDKVRPHVFIFDRFQPDPPPDEPAILFAPPASEIIEDPRVVGGDRSHPLLQPGSARTGPSGQDPGRYTGRCRCPRPRSAPGRWWPPSDAAVSPAR